MKEERASIFRLPSSVSGVERLVEFVMYVCVYVYVFSITFLIN